MLRVKWMAGQGLHLMEENDASKVHVASGTGFTPNGRECCE